MPRPGPAPKYNFDDLLDKDLGYVEFDVSGITFQEAYSKYVSVRQAAKRFVNRKELFQSVAAYIEGDIIVVELYDD